MKTRSIILAALLGIVCVFFAHIRLSNAYVSPGKPYGHVNDFANLVDIGTRADIESKLNSLETSTGVQIAVVTVDSLQGDTVENFAEKLFQEWRIGNAKQDTGLLILVSSEDRAARIEVGYGLEGAITDIQSGIIIRDVMTPYFREGDYSAGISRGVQAITEILTSAPGASLYTVSAPQKKSFFDYHWESFVFFIVIAFNALFRILGRTRSWWLGGVLGAIAGGVLGFIFGFVYIGAVAIVGLTIIGLILDYIFSKNPPGSSGAGGINPFFFGGGGSSSGSFGGFGGGSSGGGGASGRW